MRHKLEVKTIIRVGLGSDLLSHLGRFKINRNFTEVCCTGPGGHWPWFLLLTSLEDCNMHVLWDSSYSSQYGHLSKSKESSLAACMLYLSDQDMLIGFVAVILNLLTVR